MVRRSLLGLATIVFFSVLRGEIWWPKYQLEQGFIDIAGALQSGNDALVIKNARWMSDDIFKNWLDVHLTRGDPHTVQSWLADPKAWWNVALKHPNKINAEGTVTYRNGDELYAPHARKKGSPLAFLLYQVKIGTHPIEQYESVELALKDLVKRMVEVAPGLVHRPMFVKPIFKSEVKEVDTLEYFENKLKNARHQMEPSHYRLLNVLVREIKKGHRRV